MLADRVRSGIMIALNRLNNQPIMVNADLIETLESTPDTVVTLTSGNKLIVRDRPEEIQAKIIEYKRRIHEPPVTIERTEQTV
jgi:flagellar protein FlbD